MSDELFKRIDAAIGRIIAGHSPQRIPADLTDPDIVLTDCRRALEAERAAHEETKRERDELAWAAVGALMVLDDMDRSSLEIESRRPRFAWDERALMREWARAAIAKAEGER